VTLAPRPSRQAARSSRRWVLSGGSIEVLKEILGYSVVVTERYTHLRPDPFADRERSTIPLALNPQTAPSRANWAEFGQREPQTSAQPTDSEDKGPEWFVSRAQGISQDVFSPSTSKRSNVNDTLTSSARTWWHQPRGRNSASPVSSVVCTAFASR